MEIVRAYLQAVNPSSRPQILNIPARLSEHHVIGRSHFLTEDNGIISRRHAQFNMTLDENGREVLSVTNLSTINGMLINLSPLFSGTSIPLSHGDEIV